ncbi:uncharacterized protein ACA1_363810 [Acanthamoeba castellanii str. Neff]|uniref:Rhodanese domain-containing protein n=1 Tax=Acanthamoeba castellanii (strain ATCC 30010 / Neff) TaxID=1257118 RepID=L8GLD3_ACACF|nr:uncharacterized protein ACA1_363810 [Acanthamoeba castellanii str. Neff]ELR13885.1 hypothetical protein ACA1_363810 [Acanthamoeba castellanii str. Neff]
MCDLRRHLEQTGQLQFQDAHQLQLVNAAECNKPQSTEPRQEEDEKRKKWMPRAGRGERLEIGYEVEEVVRLQSRARRGRDEGFYFVHIPMGQLGQRLHELRPFIADEVRAAATRALLVAAVMRPPNHSQTSNNINNNGDQHSHLVTQQLRAIGFDRVYNLAGGLAAWTARIDDSLPSYHH